MAILFFLIRSAVYLQSAPIIDSYLWWGDESWLMLEFKQQILTGRLQHPLAFGATLFTSSGPLFGSMWLTALLYGSPAALGADPVAAGRVMTFCLSLLLLLFLYFGCRQRGVSQNLALLTCLLLLSAPIFVITSHSARYDILSSFAVLVGIFALSSERLRAPHSKTSFLIGVAYGCSLLVSIHVLLTLLFPVGYYLLRSKNWRRMIAGILGGLATLGALLSIQFLFHDSLSLFGTGGTNTTFVGNIGQIPVLRPFSRSVQWANLLQKGELLWQFSALISLFTLAAWIAIFLRPIRNITARTLALSVAALLGWLLLESSAPTSYTIYALPTLLFSSALIISDLSRPWNRKIISSVLAAVSIALVIANPFSEFLSRETQIGIANRTATLEALLVAKNDANTRRTTGRLLVMNPALHTAMEQSSLPLMTTQFIDFPASTASPREVLDKQGVTYLLLYNAAANPFVMSEAAPLRAIADAEGVLLYRALGRFTDIGVGKVRDQMVTTDTLSLYRLPF